MTAWFVHALLIGAFCSAAAFCLESALRSVHSPTRSAWSAALLLTLMLPFVPRVVATSSPIVLVPDIAVGAVTAASAPVIQASSVDWRIVWFVMSLGAAIMCSVSYLRLRRQRGRWREDVVQGRIVLVSSALGPAVLGFVRPAIVLPAWVLSATPEQQRLIVTHEAEHLHGRDHLLLLLALLAVVAMPWNPFTWLEAKRLRFAIEADCDQRVLRAVPDQQKYATLLVDVGCRRSGIALTAALAEHRNGLERRVVMIMSTVSRRPLRAAGLALAGALLVFAACESRAPTDVRQKVSEQQRDKMMAPAPDITQEPKFTPYTEAPELLNREEVNPALVRNYPPQLRAAGIGGQTMLWVLVDTRGNVAKARVEKSSGRTELDDVALAVAKQMRFSPALNESTPVNVWIQLPIVFKAE